MNNVCVYVPKKGSDTFLKLKKNLGYNKAWEVYGIGVNLKFLDKYKDTLVFDNEGIPTYDSLINNSYIKSQLSSMDKKSILQENYSFIEDNEDNYKMLLLDAYTFNNTNSEFIATVSKGPKDIRVEIKDRVQKNIDLFRNQYASNLLNRTIASILGDIGITIGNLTLEESKAGIIGVTDFNVARDIARSAVSVIRVANNMLGQYAISEEFSHLVIEIMKEEPLIKRATELLKNDNILLAILGNKYQDYKDQYSNIDILAEEALGHLLLLNLLSSNLNQVQGKLVFERLINSIKKKFKGKDALPIIDALLEANTLMNTLANNILSGKTNLKDYDIKKAFSNKKLYSLKESIDKSDLLLNKIIANELKKYKILPDSSVFVRSKDFIKDLTSLKGNPETVLQGIVNYAKFAIEDLKDVDKVLSLIESKDDIKDCFTMILTSRNVLYSYMDFTKDLEAIITDSETSATYTKEYFKDKYGEEIDLIDIVRQLSGTLSLLEKKYYSIAIPKFVKFIEPIVGDKFARILGETDISQYLTTILTRADGDISFFDRWLDSMGNSSDPILQIFDYIVQELKDKARREAIDHIKDIQNILIKANNAGIKEFDWMFERDNEGNKTGNYVSRINQGQFEKDKREFLQRLDEKYGKNATGEDAEKKLKEKRTWYSTHTIYSDENHKYFANPEYYKNPEFDAIKSDPDKFDFYTAFLNKKSEFDALIRGKATPLHAILIRKSTMLRFIDSASDPSKIADIIKGQITDSFLESNDLEEEFGVRETMIGFNGKEYLRVPALYVRDLEDPNELSMDLIGDLMTYAISTSEYAALNSVVDALEVGRDIVTNPTQRVVTEKRGEFEVLEKVKGFGILITSPIRKNSSNIADKLDDFMESQVYHKYLKDSGYTEIFGNKVNRNKFVGVLLKATSIALLGGNALANLANVATGIGMQNIEAAAREHFTASELLNADKEYMRMLTDFIPEAANNVQTSELALFDELFNVRQQFKLSSKNKYGSWFRRIFGEDLWYLGQTCGDHWLYNRTAIAMAKHYKVYKDGQEVGSVWNTLKIREYGNTKVMYVEDEDLLTYEDGSKFSVFDFKERIKDVNHRLFGIYNEEDRSAAKRVILGRLVTLYRDWMKPQFNYRFLKGITNLRTGKLEEGYYRTLARMAYNFATGKDNLLLNWGAMKKEELENMRRCLMEIVQFFAIWSICNLITWPKDKKRPLYLKLLEYIANRELHELGNLTPSLTMGKEMLKTVESPSATISAANACLKFTTSLLYPPDWYDEKESGEFKGHSSLYANTMKLPLPILSLYRKYHKIYNDLDSEIDYYTKGWL